MNAEPDPGLAGWDGEGEGSTYYGGDAPHERTGAGPGVGELERGTVVGRRYEIRGELGRGGTGVVYLAHQSDLDRLVGLKALHRIHADAADFAERFARESRLTGSLSHPNIVTVYEYFVERDTPFIAMEYVPGGSLRPWVGQLSLAQVLGVLDGLLAALAAVEPKGIVHRDLKPENLLVTEEGRVKIADFGIATASQQLDGELRVHGAEGAATVGTPEYMAPEQALSQDIDGRADLYSVGIMAFEQLTGDVPFTDVTDPIALLLRHAKGPIPSVADSHPDVDARLCEWVARLVARDPDNRPPGAQQAWEDLETLAIDLVGAKWRRDARLLGSPRNGTSSPRSSRFQSRHIPVPVVPVAAGSAVVSPGEAPPYGAIAERHGLTGTVRGLVLPAAFAVAVLVGALISLLLGAGKAAQAPEPFSASALTSAFEMRLPAKWSARGSIPQAFADLGTSAAVSMSSAGEKGQLDVGISRTSSSTLLPSSLLARLARPPSSESVQLASGAYYRYRSLDLKGLGLRTNVYAQPTTAGVVLAVCVLPTAAAASSEGEATAAVGSECERMVGSMRLRSGHALPLGPSHVYAHAVAAALTFVDAAQRSTGAQLRQAASAKAQAAATTRLANAYRQAGSMLAKAEAGPAEANATGALEQAFSRARSGYATMAAAADAGDASGFDDARSNVVAAQASTATSVERLHALGYRVSGRRRS